MAARCLRSRTNGPPPRCGPARRLDPACPGTRGPREQCARPQTRDCSFLRFSYDPRCDCGEEGGRRRVGLDPHCFLRPVPDGRAPAAGGAEGAACTWHRAPDVDRLALGEPAHLTHRAQRVPPRSIRPDRAPLTVPGLGGCPRPGLWAAAGRAGGRDPSPAPGLHHIDLTLREHTWTPGLT